jgi:hypothetical protein
MVTDMRVAATLLLCLTSMLGAGVHAADSATAPCNSCGVVVSVERSTQQEDWTPLGVVSSTPSMASGASADSRSVFAFGQGKPELVMIGAAGGAVYAKRPRSYQKFRWDVTITMDTGGQRVVQQSYEPYLRQGDHVRILGTQLELIDS